MCFESEATNLVPNDTNGAMDIFVHDLQAKTTTLVSVDSAGAQSDSRSRNCAISADGRLVAFYSGATNWQIGGAAPTNDVYLRDLQTNTTTRVSKTGSLVGAETLTTQILAEYPRVEAALNAVRQAGQIGD